MIENISKKFFVCIYASPRAGFGLSFFYWLSFAMRPSRHSNKHSRTLQRYASGIPAIGWALLSQSIWLPLLAIDAHDRWQSQVRDLKPEVASLDSASQADPANTPSGQKPPVPAGPLLATNQRDRDPLTDISVARSLEVPAAAPAPPSPSSRPSPLFSRSTTGRDLVPSASQRQQKASGPRQPFLSLRSSGSMQVSASSYSQSSGRQFSLRQPSRGPALTTLASRVVEGDPLAPLPSAWREPMRKALLQLPASNKGSVSLQAARVIYVPSERISAPATVPLAIQADGSIDIFSRPTDPLVIDELRNWSIRQPQATKGKIAPVVIHLTPIPKATTAMVSAPSSAASQLRSVSPESRPHVPSAAPRLKRLSPASTTRATVLTPPPPLPPLPPVQAAKPKIPAVDSGASSLKDTPNRELPAAISTPEPLQNREISTPAGSVAEPTPKLAPEPTPVVSAAPEPAAPQSSAAPEPVAPASASPIPSL